MEIIRLLTRTSDYVTTVTIPVMNPKPEIIIWGDRFFVRCGPEEGPFTYIEGMAWAAH